MMPEQNEMLTEFSGCDGGDPGTPVRRSIWLFGIEWGSPISDVGATHADEDFEKYAISLQKKWPYNRNAFKLLAVALGHPLEEWSSFADTVRPFEKGSVGFFKGNIFPLAFHSLGSWTKEAETYTGFSSKQEYQTWCREYRLPAIKKWVEKYHPSIFIGVGLGAVDDFSRVVFGKVLDMEELRWSSSTGQTKTLRHTEEGGLKLVVIPHLSGGRNGLNSDASIMWAGSFIRTLLAET